MDIIERQLPVTEKNPEKSKKGLYFIKDNFIEFWFKFVYPYKNYLEMENTDYVLNKIKNNFINNHVSFVYEKVCLEKIWQMNESNMFGFKILKLGKWWNREDEIDIVGYNDETKDIIFGECKYLDIEVDVDVFFDLIDKARKVQWSKNNRKEHYIIFSKSGFTSRLIELSKDRKDLILKEGC